MSVNPNEQEAAPSPEPKPEDFSSLALFQKAKGDWNKANESYFNAVNELGKTHDQLNAERAARAQLEAMLMAAAGGKPDPANQNPFAELEALGVSPQALDNALNAKADKLVEKKLSEMLGPIVNQVEAEEKLASEIENFDQHKAAARAFMKKNTEVGDVFKAVMQTNPVAAWKYAIKETLIAKQAEMPRNLPSRLPNGRTPDGRFAPANPALDANHQKTEQEAIAYMHQYGDSGPYRTARFKGTSIEESVRNAIRQAGYDPDQF
jgi:hypothetical protein